MMNQLILAKYQNQILEAWQEAGKIMELSILDPVSILDNIYIGKISNIIRDINACFIDYGAERPAYYSLIENRHILLNRTPDGTLKPGDELLIQITKEAMKAKNPVASSELSLRGEYVVVNVSGKVGISTKIKSAEEKKRLRQLAESALPDKMGCIVRTSAADCPEEAIINEISYLAEKLSQILKIAKNRTCFSCLYKSHAKYLDSFIVKYNHGPMEIISDCPDVIQDFEAYFQEKNITDVAVRLYTDSMCSLMALYNLNKELEHALKERVWLKSGAYLIIEQTEAMVVIDVNTGKSITNQNTEEHLLKINSEAAIEICRQLRIRNLSGIIMIDFINMRSEASVRQLQDILVRELMRDSVPAKFVDITKLGLVELTRKKIRRSLKEQTGGSI